jgi:hypothetical protein
MTEPLTARDRLLWALQERAKELACLYEVEELLNDSARPLPEVFAGIIAALPPGWQHPDQCQARIDYEGRSFTTPDHVETPWVQGADIVVQDRVVGRVSVSYRIGMPHADEGPFLAEESRLIRTIADRLGHYILHQHLREVSQALRTARNAAAGTGTAEWRSALNLLRRTDQELFINIAHKMANHLSWSGVTEAQALLPGFGDDGRQESTSVLGERNEPSVKVTFDSSVELAEQVFRLAATNLSDEEILSRIQKWVHEDRASFLVKIVVNVQTSPAEVAEAIRRYLHILPQGAGLSDSTLNAVRVHLIRRFLSDDLEYIKIAKEFVGLEDMLGALERLIFLPGTHGRFGGKSAGLFLAHQILTKVAGQTPEVGALRVPKTWFIATDVVLEFLAYNNLEELYEQKYKSIDQVRQEYPLLVRVFQNSHFPPEVVNALSVALDELHDGPLIVRSSSLLEDRLGAAFSGKYKSLFIANQGSKRERLAALLNAIAEVYSSIFSPDPIQYRAERGLLDFREEMGVMVQEVVGTKAGRYFFPAYAGVAFSHNEFRWSPRIRREDGLIRLVPGLGTRAVDRLRDDYPVLVAPGKPNLRVNVTPDEVARYSPQFMDVINLERGGLESVRVRDLLAECGSEVPAAGNMVSVLADGRLTGRAALMVDFEHDPLVVTFEGLISGTPFLAQIGTILRVLQERLGHPVDVEFASDGAVLHLLQCRPQTDARGAVSSPIPKDIASERIVFSANRFVSNGRVPDITHLVYVDPDRYNDLQDHADLLAVGRAVSRLNTLLPKRQFILMGPGRWGSRGDVKLGVHVTYSDICNTAVLVEIARARGGYVPDLSFGTHFFQDLVEASIRYLPLYPEQPGVIFNERFLLDAPNELAALVPEHAALAEVVRVVDVGRVSPGEVIRVVMNAEQDRALAYLAPSGQTEESADKAATAGRESSTDHWRWRLRMAERIAAELDARRFGVVAFYVFGSTKNATAGPGSDIDILVHVRGDEAQRQAVGLWLEGWSLCLAEMNYLRTGSRSDGLLDVHLITDDDIARRTSYAAKIGATTDAARELTLRKTS